MASSHDSSSQRTAREEVQRILDNTDWGLYSSRYTWRVRMPYCSFYDGGRSICSAWINWLKLGRSLYQNTSEGERDYFSAVRENIRLSSKQIRNALQL